MSKYPRKAGERQRPESVKCDEWAPDSVSSRVAPHAKGVVDVTTVFGNVKLVRDFLQNAIKIPPVNRAKKGVDRLNPTANAAPQSVYLEKLLRMHSGEREKTGETKNAP